MNGADDLPKPAEPVILGAELAAASAIEQARLQSGPAASPLAYVNYDRSAAHVESLSFNESASDGLLRTLANEWARLGAGDLAQLRSTLSMHDFYTLMTFARRSLVLALRTGDPSWPQSALHGLTAIAYERVDYRDLTLAAGLVAYAIEATDQDVKAAFRSASARSGSGTSEVLNRFVEQPAWTLAECGYEQVGMGTQTTLVRRNFEAYSPTVDLGSIAREIAITIETDAYAVETISIADQLPSVWLRGSSLERMAAASLEHATGCASVRASRSDETSSSHVFVVFVVELQSPDDAVAVAQSAAECSGSHARLALSEGSICAVLIARSAVQGEPDLEDDRSLGRFAAGFAAALRSGIPKQS